MKLAALPFNAMEGTKPAIGRQLSNFACDTVRAATQAEINSVSFLTQIEEGPNGRAAFINIADTLLDRQWIDQMFEQSGVDVVMDGLVEQREDQSFRLIVRFHAKDSQEPIWEETTEFPLSDLFAVLHKLVQKVAEMAGTPLPPELSAQMDFGTDDPVAFLKFLEGYDALTYIQQTQGRVANEFSPEAAIATLLESCRADADFLGPYETLVQLARLCAQFRIGSLEMVEKALEELKALAPNDFRAQFALAEVYESVGDAARGSDGYEKALKIREERHNELVEAGEEDPGYEQEMAAMYTRIGRAQLNLNMPVNAERNFRRALELEGPDKPSLDWLAMVLANTGRAHEVPSLWEEQVRRNPENPHIRAKYAISLVQAGREEDGVKAFEDGIAAIADNIVLKRYFAPILAQRGDHDRAMDFYEDALDVAPTDVPVLLEYSQVLEKAGREFEVPKVLRDVLAANPDPNTRAMALAKLIELEQPKRAAMVEAAREKMEAGDYEGALRDLKPLRNWLADYWKMWALLSSAHNHLMQPTEAEEAARNLIDLFPACEPAYGELATALFNQNRAEEAYHLLRIAAANMPQSLPVHVNLALAARRAGHVDEARALARQIRELVGPNPELEQILREIDG
ncbi:MAG: tetratricopeptide repeat protein [Fimbriimonadaceae bacterium]